MSHFVTIKQDGFDAVTHKVMPFSHWMRIPWACQTDKNERAELVLDLDPTVNEANLVVHFDMPVHRRLRFTQKHLIDLQAAIKDWLEAAPEPVDQESSISNR